MIRSGAPGRGARPGVRIGIETGVDLRNGGPGGSVPREGTSTGGDSKHRGDNNNSNGSSSNPSSCTPSNRRSRGGRTNRWFYNRCNRCNR